MGYMQPARILPGPEANQTSSGKGPSINVAQAAPPSHVYRSRPRGDDTSAEQRRVKPAGWPHARSTTPDADTGVSNAHYSIARLHESGHQATDAELMLTPDCGVGVRNSWPSLYAVGGWEREHGTMMEAPPLGYGDSPLRAVCDALRLREVTPHA